MCLVAETSPPLGTAGEGSLGVYHHPEASASWWLTTLKNWAMTLRSGSTLGWDLGDQAVKN